jgi:formylglycine-generating enzyme required for sulfatase activity
MGCWNNPGFNQGPTHPVCGISWDDAHAFCLWLTKKEQQMGVIAKNHMYRLPTDAEWGEAVGASKYPWGNQWPPPAGAGNFAGEEILDANWPSNSPCIHGYRDGFARTSPVGTFAANQYGLYDLVGNLGEWCEDCFQKEMKSDWLRPENPNPMARFIPPDSRIWRGAAWSGGTPGALASSNHRWGWPDARSAGIGFRVVLANDKVLSTKTN